MAAKRALIFDMDGTIVDNMAFHTQSWITFFERRGRAIDADEFFRTTAGRQGKEIIRSLSKRVFAASLARLVPAITGADIVRAGAGVRAQAIRRDGTLADDFIIQRTDNQVHVLNAPSPAATSSLEIADYIVRQAGVTA